MIIAAVVFFVSLGAIVVLFGFKYWELGTERAVATGMRDRADVHALRVKRLILTVRDEAEKLPPQIVRFLRIFVRDSALGVALIARVIERQAHRLADFVSHKHRFERRESTNDYLKQVSEREERHE